MPELLIYKTTAELPSHFFYQKESFVRMMWIDIDDFNIELGWKEKAAHFVVADGKKLISYAAVLSVELELNGIIYRCGGVSSVMTFPALRKKGYGSQVVKAATDYIRNEKFDFGLLWTAPRLEKFYSQYGWEFLSGVKIFVGESEQAAILDDGWHMWFFSSDKAKQNCKDFEEAELYVGKDMW